jgi:hypothetical protein
MVTLMAEATVERLLAEQRRHYGERAPEELEREVAAVDWRLSLRTTANGYFVHAPGSGSDASGQVHEVLLAVQRVRRRAAARRRFPCYRAVAGELGLEHALAARQTR